MRINDWSSDVCSSDLVRKREGDLAPRRVRHVDRAPHRRARPFGIPQIAFAIEDLGIGDPCLVDHRLIEQVARAEKGVRRALTNGGGEDQVARSEATGVGKEVYKRSSVRGVKITENS